ncbi:hypothetical protein F53441_2853 [Fusarium austroafricanum]|uniref:Uncharacterized protein n=1 Tax=Fusarium austroafricanum TaxID=2364996 RepID=A0A8H4KRA6_9HYPO|nr:hypothetical protein F53441_2853 [Fusarium austroafricanum]
MYDHINLDNMMNPALARFLSLRQPARWFAFFCKCKCLQTVGQSFHLLSQNNSIAANSIKRGFRTHATLQYPQSVTMDPPRQETLVPKKTKSLAKARNSQAHQQERGPADDPVSAGNDDGPISAFCSERRRPYGLPRLYGAESGGWPSDGIGYRHGGT